VTHILLSQVTVYCLLPGFLVTYLLTHSWCDIANLISTVTERRRRSRVLCWASSQYRIHRIQMYCKNFCLRAQTDKCRSEFSSFFCRSLFFCLSEIKSSFVLSQVDMHCREVCTEMGTAGIPRNLRVWV